MVPYIWWVVRNTEPRVFCEKPCLFGTVQGCQNIEIKIKTRKKRPEKEEKSKNINNLIHTLFITPYTCTPINRESSTQRPLRTPLRCGPLRMQGTDFLSILERPALRAQSPNILNDSIEIPKIEPYRAQSTEPII